MKIDTTKATESIIDSLKWEIIGTSEDTLSRVLADAAIIHAEPLDYPLTDGVFLYFVDAAGKPRILEISVSNGLIDDPDTFSGIPLSIRLSEPLIKETG